MKKLALYSDQEIPENASIDRRMLALIDKPHPLVGYIPSSADPDRKWFKIKQAYYAAIGVTLTDYFELDDHFEPDALSSLMQCDAIHLSGGNTYHFLYWLRRRGMLEVLRNYVKNGGVLIGNSAGSILMTPEINSTALCEDIPLLGEESDDLSALGLVDFAFYPHINLYSNYREVMIKYSLEHPYPIYGCADGNGIIVDGDEIEFIGPIMKAQNGIISPAN
jgi:dipeptidase E